MTYKPHSTGRWHHWTSNRICLSIVHGKPRSHVQSSHESEENHRRKHNGHAHSFHTWGTIHETENSEAVVALQTPRGKSSHTHDLTSHHVNHNIEWRVPVLYVEFFLLVVYRLVSAHFLFITTVPRSMSITHMGLCWPAPWNMPDAPAIACYAQNLPKSKPCQKSLHTRALAIPSSDTAMMSRPRVHSVLNFHKKNAQLREAKLGALMFVEALDGMAPDDMKHKWLPAVICLPCPLM